MMMRNLLSLVLVAVLGVGVVGSGTAQAATPGPEAPAAPVNKSSSTAKPLAGSPQAAPARQSDAARYAEREQKAGNLQDFRGGGASIYIGGSVLTVALIILLVIIIL